jgi:hypothetical protein
MSSISGRRVVGVDLHVHRSGATTPEHEWPATEGAGPRIRLACLRGRAAAATSGDVARDGLGPAVGALPVRRPRLTHGGVG